MWKKISCMVFLIFSFLFLSYFTLGQPSIRTFEKNKNYDIKEIIPNNSHILYMSKLRNEVNEIEKEKEWNSEQKKLISKEVKSIISPELYMCEMASFYERMITILTALIFIIYNTPQISDRCIRW